ncbi:MAG TPA: YdeI/OmpD-associated family protein [Acidobacteriota bacterium]|nr:YdeI/OmpD-associated family protein [Acidobacteriota bacterium]
MKQTGQRRFRATLEGTEKGRVYVTLPFDPATLWGPRGRYYVAGTIGGTKFRGRLDQSAKGHFLPLGPVWRRTAGLRPGDAVEVVIGDENPPRDGLAPDVAAALDADPEAGGFYDALAGFYRKNYLRWIDSTKRRPDVRAARIAELVQLLKSGHKQRPR